MLIGDDSVSAVEIKNGTNKTQWNIKRKSSAGKQPRSHRVGKTQLGLNTAF